MKPNPHKEFEEKLSQGNACYVLITCSAGAEGGTLNVEMSYGGDDPALASYLLSDAQAYIEDSDEMLQ